MADAYRGLTIRIGGDTTKLTAALRAASKAASQTQTQLRAIDKASRFDPDSVENASIRLKLMEERAESLASQLKTTNTAYRQLGDSIPDGAAKSVRELSDETGNAALAAQRALDRYNRVDGELENLYVSINKAARASEDLDDKFDLRKADDIDKTAQSLVELGVITQDTADELSYMRGLWKEAFSANEAAKAVQTFRELEVKASGLDSEIRSLSRGMAELKAPSGLSRGLADSTAQAERMAAQIKALEADIRKCDAALKLDPSNVSAAQRKMADLASASDLAARRAEVLSSQMERYESAGVGAAADDMGRVALEAQRANSAYADSVEALSKARASLGQLRVEQQRVSDSASSTDAEYEQAAAAVSKAESQVRQLEAAERSAANARDSANMALEYDQLRSSIAQATSQAEGFRAAMSNIGTGSAVTLSSIKGIGMTLSATLTPAMQMVGEYAVQSATDIDSAYRDMRKTVNGTEGDFVRLKQAALDFSNQNITSADQILQIQAIGGELGIATDDLETFAETVSNLDIATNLDADDAATALGTLSNILNDLNGDTMPRFADSLVRLGNNGASTESQIVEVASRIGSMGSIVGMSTPDILAWASAIASTGQKSEAAGTAISKTMSNIETAVAKGGDAVQGFADVAGMSAEEFASTWESDPTDALKAFIEGLAEIEEGGGSADKTLQDLGITAVRQKQGIEGLMQSIGNLDDSLEMSENAWNGVSDQWGAAGDAAREAQAKNEGLAGSIQRIKNTVQNAASEIGDAIAPIVSDIADFAADLGEAFADTDDGFKQMVAGAGLLTAGLGPGLSIVGSFGNGIKNLTKFLNKGGTAWGKLASGAGSATNVLGTAASATDVASTAIQGMTLQQKAAAAGSKLLAAGLGLVKTGLIGLAVAGVAVVVEKYAEMAQEQELVNEALTGADEIIDGAEESVGGYGDALEDLSVSSKETLESLRDLNDEFRATMEEQAGNEYMLDGYLQTIRDLEGQSNLTASQQDALKRAVEGYNEVTGESVEVTDAANGKLSESVKELEKSAQAWEENARAQAYASAAQKYLEEQAEAELRLADSQKAYNDTLEEQNKRMAEAQKSFDDGMMSEMEYNAVKDDAKLKIQEVTEELDKQKAAVDQTAEDYEYLSTQAMILGSTLSTELKDALTGLPAEMQQGGYDIAMSLATGIESGNLTTQQAIKFITGSVKGSVSKLPAELQPMGLSMANSLANGISSGNLTVQEASSLIDDSVSGVIANLPPNMQQMGLMAAQSLAKEVAAGNIDAKSAANILRNAANGGVASLPDDMGDNARKAVSTFASGIRSGKTSAKTSGRSVANSAKEGAGSVSAYNEGANLASGFARGISAFADTAVRAAASMAQSALEEIQKVQNSHSPSREAMKLGGYLPEGYSLGIDEGAAKAAKSAGNMAKAALRAAQVDSYASTVSAGVSAMGHQQTPVSVNVAGDSVEAARLVLSALPAIISEYTPVMGERDFNRAVNKAVR